MKYKLDEAIAILERTPRSIEALLSGLSDNWIRTNEGEDTWSPFDVVGHLIHGEKTDWIPRLEAVLGERKKEFEPFDRFAQFEESKGKPMQVLLQEFKHRRAINLEVLRSKQIAQSDFEKTGVHPDFGEVTLSQLLATWVAHDLSHISQIARVMAFQYKEEVGPWKDYLRILHD